MYAFKCMPILLKFAIVNRMKKNSPIIYIIIGVVTLFITLPSISPNGNFYDYLPNYYLFEMPSDPTGGDVLHSFFKFYSLIFIFVLLSFLVNSVNKNQGLNFIKIIKKLKKNKESGPIFVVLFFALVIPLLVTLCDYINLSIGISFKDFSGESERMFPFAQLTLFSIWLIFILINILKKK